jgi:hypothetical protein
MTRPAGSRWWRCTAARSCCRSRGRAVAHLRENVAARRCGCRRGHRRARRRRVTTRTFRPPQLGPRGRYRRVNASSSCSSRYRTLGPRPPGRLTLAAHGNDRSAGGVGTRRPPSLAPSTQATPTPPTTSSTARARPTG